MKRYIADAKMTSVYLFLSLIAVFAAAPDAVAENYNSMWKTDWSPDGIHIAFSADDVYIVDITTGEVENLTDGFEYAGKTVTFPAFSHDGTKLFFSWRDDDRNAEKYDNGMQKYHTDYIDLKTGERVPFLKDAYALNVSRDGKFAVYIKELRCYAVYDFETGEETLYQFNNNEAPYFVHGHCAFGLDSSFFIATFGTLPERPDSSELNEYYKLFKVDRVTGDAEILDVGDLSYWYPEYSPDGSMLVLSQVDYYSKIVPMYPKYLRDPETHALIMETGAGIYAENVFIKNPDTDEYKNLTYSNYYAVKGHQNLYGYDKETGEYYDLSQNSEIVSKYEKTRITHRMMYIVAIYDIGTGILTPLHGEGYFQSKMASWSPDGGSICYILSEEFEPKKQRRYIYIYNLKQGSNTMFIDGMTGEVVPFDAAEE